MDENRGQGVHDRQKIDDHSKASEREQSVSPEMVLSAVANQQRRAIINSLIDASENTLDYETLVDRVADTVRDEDGDGASEEHRQRVRIALHHTHLPKLEEIQMVDYTAETGNVQFVGGELPHDLLGHIKSYETSN